MFNISEVIIGITEFKSKLYETLSSKATKIIIKNNKPVSAVMPYEEYLALKEQASVSMANYNRMGQVIILDNGVPVITTVQKEDNMLCIKLYVVMKNSGNHKLYHTFYISMPPVESVYTINEIVNMELQKMENLQNKD